MDKNKKDQLFSQHSDEQLIHQARNSTPQQRLELAEELLELYFAAGHNYHENKALTDPEYKKRRGLL